MSLREAWLEVPEEEDIKEGEGGDRSRRQAMYISPPKLCRSVVCALFNSSYYRIHTTNVCLQNENNYFFKN